MRDHNEYVTYPLLFGRDNWPEALFDGHFNKQKIARAAAKDEAADLKGTKFGGSPIHRPE